jgi:hypothetical protein
VPHNLCRRWPSVLSWLEFSLIFESDATACLMPEVHQTFPPAICPPLPFQQESAYPCPISQDLARLRPRGDVLREAVEALAQPSRHRNRQRDTLGGVRLLAITFGFAMSLEQRLTGRLAMVRAAVRGSPNPDGKALARSHAFRLAAPICDLAVLATFFAGDMCHVTIVRRSRPGGKPAEKRAHARDRIQVGGHLPAN